jgi:hypothetical protein
MSYNLTDSGLVPAVINNLESMIEQVEFLRIQYDALQLKYQAVEKDANRYQYIRSRNVKMTTEHLWEDDLDKAIDKENKVLEISEHTPGPWVIHRGASILDGKMFIGKMSDNPGVGAKNETRIVCVFQECNIQQVKDARLIAAAPDLLTALEDLLSAFDFQMSSYEDQQVQKDARLALTKAIEG